VGKRPMLVAVMVMSAFCAASVGATGAGSNPPEASTNPEIGRAVSVWQRYVTALKESDHEKAKACWSDRARQDGVVDWQMPEFDEAVAAARADSLALGDVEEHDGYTRLHVTWYGDDRSYYVVHAQGRAVLANPIEVLTRGWSERETPFLVCHYAEGNEPTSDELRALNDFCGKVSADLGIPLGAGRKLDYYRCDTPRQVGDLFGMGPAVGRAYWRTATVAAASWVSFHEIVHALLGPTCRQQPVSLLLEGAACYFGGVTVLTRDAQLSWAKALLENHEGLPLARLVQEDDFWAVEDMNDTYAEAAAFAGYLIATRGVEAFKTLYAYRDSTEDLAGVLERLCGESLAQVETDWHGWLLRQQVPTIGLDNGHGTTRVFAMEDPPRDDVGDGGFTYPLGPGYQPGMFDLTGFEVRVGRGKVYFTLKYRYLVDWGGDPDLGFSGTYTRIAVDAGGHGDDLFDRDAHATITGHCDYRIEVSDYGVIVGHDDRIMAVLKRPPRGAKLGDTRRNVVRFSVPCAETEESIRRWRYAVAVGGRAGGGKHLREGVGKFMAVTRTATKETGGGGRDESGAPGFYDVLLPAGQNQQELLGHFDGKDPKKVVVLPMLRE
jgi:hypothetical protein